MKKIILFIAAMLAFTSCDTNKMYEPTTNSKGITEQLISSDVTTNIKKITIEDHEYLVFEQSVYCGMSIAVVHSESCPCHNKDVEK